MHLRPAIFPVKKLMADSPSIISRHIIESFISQEWELYLPIAHTYLSDYLADIEMRINGVPLAELNYSQRRLQQSTTIILPGQTEPTQITSNHTVNLNSNTDVQPGSIVHFKMTGPMRLQDGLSSRGIIHLTNQINEAKQNPNIVGAILEVDSAGGESRSGSLLQNVMAEFNKPIHIYSHLLASAALKGVLPADRLFASGDTVQVGSIGTMLSLNKKFIEFLKENQEDIYASDATGKNKEFRAYLNGDRGPYIEMLDKINDKFVNAVQQFRTLKGSAEQFDRAYSGEIFLADEALNMGLIDGIGTFSTVLSNLREDIRQGAHFTKRINRLPAAAVSNNQNFDNMKLQEFWSKLFPVLNSKFGFSFQEETKLDEAIDEISQAKSMDEIKQEIKDEILEDLKPAAAPKEAEQAQETEVDLSEMIKQINQKMDAMSTQINTLQGDKKKLEDKVAELTGQELDTNESGEHNKTNGGDNPQSRFKTINQAVKLPGKSKY